MEASFQAATLMEVQVEGVELAHKTPPRVPPKPTSKSPTPASLVAKVAGGRHQSPSPVRHVKAPTPTPVRWVEPLCIWSLECTLEWAFIGHEVFPSVPSG